MEFWKNHSALRISLITIFFLLGITLVIVGWKMTGELRGLGIMVLGLVSLLAGLQVYNFRYQEPKC